MDIFHFYWKYSILTKNEKKNQYFFKCFLFDIFFFHKFLFAWTELSLSQDVGEKQMTNNLGPYSEIFKFTSFVQNKIHCFWCIIHLFWQRSLLSWEFFRFCRILQLILAFRKLAERAFSHNLTHDKNLICLFTLAKMNQSDNFPVNNGLFVCKFKVLNPIWHNLFSSNHEKTFINIMWCHFIISKLREICSREKNLNKKAFWKCYWWKTKYFKRKFWDSGRSHNCNCKSSEWTTSTKDWWLCWRWKTKGK